MKPIAFSHQYDPDLKLTVQLPAGQAGEDAFAEYFDRGRNDYQACYDFTRACAVEPKGEQLSDLIKNWSGVVIAAARTIWNTLDFDSPRLLDPREVVASYSEHAKTPGMPAQATIEQWIRQYPRKGPPGQAQFGIAVFDFGAVPYRAPEPTEWFAVESMRKAGKSYAVLRSFVQSCTLSDVGDVLERNKSNPLLVLVLGQYIRNAAGDDFAVRMGE